MYLMSFYFCFEHCREYPMIRFTRSSISCKNTAITVAAVFRLARLFENLSRMFTNRIRLKIVRLCFAVNRLSVWRAKWNDTAADSDNFK